MKSKRLLSLLLALCLTVGVMTPAASAVSVTAPDSADGSESSGWLNDLVISAAEALGIHTLRDDKTHANATEDKLSLIDGKWVATSVDGISVELTEAELPDYIQALRKASEYYGVMDRVAAFIVLEADPTSEQYSSISAVPAAKTQALEGEQEELLSALSQAIPDGSLDVISRFTYLTNAVVVETEFGNLEPIAAMEGVKSVFISPVYSACEAAEVMNPYTVSSGTMTGVSTTWTELGYTGTGMTIAILDTGLDLDHPSFADDPAMNASSWTLESVQALLDTYDLRCEELYGGALTAEDLYYNAKVPFAFNYSSGSTNVSHADGIGDHGTHVAGIAAANALEGSGVAGMAPDAQIIAMKVFDSETGGANMYDIIEALEDCMTMGVDVVNMSLGSPAGFSETGIEEIDSIFQRIGETDMIVDVAAGNEATSSYGSYYGYYMQPTEHIDNATVSSPSTYVNVLSIASVNNSYVYTPYFSLANGSKVFYMQSVEYLYAYIDFSLEVLADQELEYVIVPGLGEEADFYDENGNSIVDGKIAVVHRGDITFSEKSFNAQNAGAVGVLIWNNVSEDIFSFGMTTSDDEGNYPEIPVVLITLEDGQIMADAANKTLTAATDEAPRYDVSGGQMSNFSCWGVAPDLRLLPDMTGVGGNVYSCYDGGAYGLMSGTSMATPQVAGVTALVLQYLKEQFPDATTAETRMLVDSLMMSTAVPVIDSTTGLEASPRQQGAGLVNASAAITAGAYLSVEGSERPKAELGDSTQGSFSFTFTVHNYGDAEKSYTLSSSLLCEDYFTDEAYPEMYFMAETEHELDNAAVSFSASSVTVPAGGSAQVTVTIDLTQADKDWIDTYFPSGNYVEGFVYLVGTNEVTLSLPFLGFYGEWDDAPIFDTGYWYDNGVWLETEELDEVECNEFYHIIWTSLGSSTNDWILGYNPYTGATYDEEGNVIYDPANNVLSPNGDGVLDNITDYYLSLMRNAKMLYLTYTDAEGNVLDVEGLEDISKTMYISGYGSNIPFVYNWYYDSLYDLTDAEGNYLADGAEIYLTISGVIDYEGAEEQIMTTIPLYVDTTAPVLGEEITESTDEEGNYLTLTITDAHPAYVALMNSTGTQVYRRYSDADMTDNGDGTYSITVDVTGLGDHFVAALCDYGCNEAYYELSYTLTENLPEVSEDTLYAYQVYNEYIFYYYGWDYMFGWSTIDKETAEVTMVTSDIYEYYAIAAADYAGGYIFAVDAGYNLIYMVPGLFDRNLICNLGVNVVDMAFDETTQTMYLATKTKTASGDYACGLYTVDLLTGELTLLKDYGSQFNMPWAMTFVDGRLYAARYYYNGLYEIDLEGGTYELNAVLGADGSDFIPELSTGVKASPTYGQSMTYSAKDGVIYWAFYGDNGQELLVIDPETWTCTGIPFSYDQEYSGLLTVEDDGYTIPESDAVTRLVISQEQVILASGSVTTLEAIPLPWNAPASEILWSSSDESIATVDEFGNVTAVSEGEAIITASCGGLKVTCAVAVVDASGTLHAYNYYSGDGTWGTWLDVDLSGMTAESVCDSEIDFIAADYNGHNGKIYGFDEYGQCYWFDPATGEYDTLGMGGTLVPGDMAYDYTTGLMYAAVYDYNSWSTTIYCLNMSTGSLVEYATGYGVYLTLACSTDGQLYGIDYYGKLYSLTIPQGASYFNEEELLDTGVGELYYAQSMCYDHVNDVLLWASPETGNIYWVDFNAQTPYILPLGEPTGSGLIEYVGLYVIPETVEELPYVPVTKIAAEDMLVLVGDTLLPSVSVYPLNATNQSGFVYSSSNPKVAKVENGVLVGVSEGTAIIRATMTDNGKMYSCRFTVTVKQDTDNIYGYLMSDIGSYDGYYWAEFSDENTLEYQPTEYVYYNGSYLVVYAAENVDGTIYAYGYNADDWNANFQFLTIDARTWSVLSARDMGDGFNFVYDMAFDYTTGIMYALAGPSDNATDLYYVNLNNGELIECLLTEPMFMSLAIDGEGNMYAMAASESSSDEFSSSVAGNAMLYSIDVENGTYEVYMDTGFGSNMLASMAYDFDTGYIYWTGLLSTTSGYQSGLYLIDLEEKACYNLGRIGSAGAQVTALMIFADEYPEVSNELYMLAFRNSIAEVAVGATNVLQAYALPFSNNAELTWSCADESIATVDENGVVTGISAGITTVTVTAEDEGKVCTATCKVIVYGLRDQFLTYNWTKGCFTTIDRPDTTETVDRTGSESGANVRAMVMLNGTLYAYDEEGNFFTASEADNYKRTYLGSHGLTMEEGYDEVLGYYSYHYDYTFTVRDMAWDAANNRMLALGCYGTLVTRTYDYEGTHSVSNFELELLGGCRLYEVDMETGALTELFVIGDNEAGVYSLAVTDDGEAYIYSTFMDYVSKLDLQTGAVTMLSTLQNQGVYGASDGEPMAMVYDPEMDAVYLLFTANGKTYSLYRFDVGTTAISYVGTVGDGSSIYGGLVINEYVPLVPTGILGDANCDGLVDSDDAAMILKYDVSMVDETFLDLAVADVNGDGVVDSDDASLILKYDVGLIEELPAAN